MARDPPLAAEALAVIWLEIVLAAGITVALAGMWGIALVNVFALPRLDLSGSSELPERSALPTVSILIPARDEAHTITTAVTSLLAQDYPRFDLHILDDNSSDGTAHLARVAGDADPRLHVHAGADLPPGWLGKNWACHQLAQSADGELLLFTDADVRWQPGALRALAAEWQRTQADLLTVWPTQITETWGERLVVPLMTLVVVGYLPIPLVHHTPWRLFAAANGQGLLFRRAAYDKINGHAGIKSSVLEDVTVARRIKQAGLRLRLVDGDGFVFCRMYRDWRETFNGYAKNILAGYGNSMAALGLATLFHWAVFLWPWLWLSVGDAGWVGWPWWPASLALAGLGIRALTAKVMGQRMGDALLMPLSVLLMTGIAAKAIWWQLRYGGPVWKGRVVKQ